MRITHGILGAALGSLLASLAACASMDASEAASAPDAGTGGGAQGGSGGAGGSATDAGTPPEEELEGTFQTPVVTGAWLWTANPESGRVARIDARTLEVTMADAGDGPTYLAALPGSRGALVLNVRSRDATWFTAREDGRLEAATFAVHPGANSWTVSHSGRWAIAWSDARRVERPDPSEGFQDVTLVDLSGAPAPLRFSVGWRPSRVFLDTAESRAFFVTDAGLTVISLEASPRLLPDVPLTSASDEGLARDVTLTPDGALALVRREGVSSVTLLDTALATGVEVPLDGPVTDLDLSEDGRGALAVARSASQVAWIPLPDALTDPGSVRRATLDGAAVGSAALVPDASQALLFSTASEEGRVVLLPVPGLAGARGVDVKAPVRAVLAAPDGGSAIALLTAPHPRGAFAVVPVDTTLPPRVQSSEAPIVQVAFSPDGSRALLTERDEDRRAYGVSLVRLPGLRVDRVALTSAPESTGMVPEAGVGFVAQAHPEGRITFVDLATGRARTLTGFELAAKVKE